MSQVQSLPSKCLVPPFPPEALSAGPVPRLYQPGHLLETQRKALSLMPFWPPRRELFPVNTVVVVVVVVVGSVGGGCWGVPACFQVQKGHTLQVDSLPLSFLTYLGEFDA